MENLENTKRTAQDIEVKVAEAITTEVKINEARELYRPAAARASLLYFILNDLEKINPLYQFSLKVRTAEKTIILCNSQNTVSFHSICITGLVPRLYPLG